MSTSQPDAARTRAKCPHCKVDRETIAELYAEATGPLVPVAIICSCGKRTEFDAYLKYNNIILPNKHV